MGQGEPRMLGCSFAGRVKDVLCYTRTKEQSHSRLALQELFADLKELLEVNAMNAGGSPFLVQRLDP